MMLTWDSERLGLLFCGDYRNDTLLLRVEGLLNVY